MSHARRDPIELSFLQGRLQFLWASARRRSATPETARGKSATEPSIQSALALRPDRDDPRDRQAWHTACIEYKPCERTTEPLDKSMRITECES